MSLILVLLFLLSCTALDPQLINISSKNQCIKSIVSAFLTTNTCQRLSQQSKSELAIKMTNCLFDQMGKPKVNCQSPNNCLLNGDSWNTFTTFFTHIDNLCHFYWQVSKAQRTENMIDALVTSAQNTQKTLEKNNQNTRYIIQLQNSLKIQILSSIATQQQMSQIISNSSLAINLLTSEITSSLIKIHNDIDQNYAVVTRILSSINQVIMHLDSLKMFLVAQVCSIQGVLFFFALFLLIFIFSVISQRVRARRNQSLILISIHFLLEFFLSTTIQKVIGIHFLRFTSISLIILLVLVGKEQKNKYENILSNQLSSQRIKRIMMKALKNYQLQLKVNDLKTNTISA